MLVFEPEPEPPKTQILIVGIVASPEFHLCRCYVERLVKSFPKEYSEPDVRPLLDVDWHAFLNKTRRSIGGEKIWALDKHVAVFMNEQFLGDDIDLLKFVAVKYQMAIVKDFDQIGRQRLLNYLSKQSDLGRYFVYLTIAINDNVVGSLLFQLYSDLVPSVADLFLKRCKNKRHGYTGTPIQRIVVPSWIQCGGWKMKHYNIPCENYVVPHDRRGVLSMCHNGKHTDNSTQFFITLDPTPWMDYKYVAFGQLIQGEEILRLIEKTPTNYEVPEKKIEIVKTGEFNFYTSPDPKEMAELDRYIANRSLHEDILDPRDAKSELLRRRFNRGAYGTATDMQSYAPFLHLPEYLIYKSVLAERIKEAEPEEEMHAETKTSYTDLHSKAKESKRFNNLY